MNRKKRVFTLGILALGLGIYLTPSAYAVSFSVDPWIIILEPQKNILSQVITLKYVGDETKNNENPLKKQGTAPIPVELSMLTRIVDENGVIQYPNKTPPSEFVIFPSQVILYPGDEQKVQLQWVSDKFPTKEISFGLISAQVPVDIDDGGVKYTKPMGQVTILTRYEGIVVMRPSGIKPKIKVDSVYGFKDSLGANRMLLLLSNQGTGMQSLKEMKMQIIPLDKSGKVDFTKKLIYTPELPKTIVENALFADGKRRIIVPWPPNLTSGPIQAIPIFP